MCMKLFSLAYTMKTPEGQQVVISLMCIKLFSLDLSLHIFSLYTHPPFSVVPCTWVSDKLELFIMESWIVEVDTCLKAVNKSHLNTVYRTRHNKWLCQKQTNSSKTLGKQANVDFSLQTSIKHADRAMFKRMTHRRPALSATQTNHHIVCDITYRTSIIMGHFMCLFHQGQEENFTSFNIQKGFQSKRL